MINEEEEEDREGDELALFTKDGVSKLADNISTLPQQPKATNPQQESLKEENNTNANANANKPESHFKSVLKELEENVSDDDDDDDVNGGNNDEQRDENNQDTVTKKTYDKER